MGDPERWPQASSLTPEGVSLFSAAFSASVAKGNDWWAKAEEWAAELITCIQPTWSSEKRRQSVVDYVQFLIRRGIDCQVVTFGSVPLKTYLPDGDIDLTAFSLNHVQKDTWAEDVHRILEKAEQNSDSEFRVKEVQLIHAEVKIVKCLVENIVVDISFNQIGGLCTLCFLEEVDRLVGQDHLFKRSVILVKAWCYYESRILGAHHGLISTYALETLVLYIFHVFHSSLRGPLQVLYMFLEFFSNFDWDRYCVSLWGPVPLASVPVVAAEPPRIDGGELLLTKAFLDACSETYGIVPIGQDAKSNMFHMKFLNIIDPLRIANNLGRSVSKGNFCRIRSAFGFGARKLARIVNTSKGKVAEELNTIFDCTLTRHGGHQRPDASDPTHKLPLAPTSGAGIFSSENKSAEWSTLGSKEILHPPSVGETFDPGICRPDFHTFSQPMPADSVGMQSMRASKAILNHVTGYQGTDTITALSSSAGESQSAEGNCRECGEGLTNGGNSNGNVGVIKCEISRCMSCYASGQTTLVKSRNGQDPSLEVVINHCGNLFGTPVDIAAESSQQIMPSGKSGSGYLVDNSSSQNGSPVVRTEKESCIRIAAQSTHGLAPPSLSVLLASDFGRHLQDLANGLWCQRPPIPSTTFLPAPKIALSTKDLHINGLWKGQGQPRHNMSTHMGFGPLHQVPFTMVQSQGQMAAASYQQLPIGFSSVEVSARPRGTGTYLPILRQNVHRDRRSHGGKQGGGQNGYYGQKDRTNSTVHHEGTTQSPRSLYRGGSRVQQSRQGLWLPSQNANEGGQGEQKVSGSGRGHVHHRLQQQVQLDRESYQSPPATLSGSNSSAVSVTPGGTYPLPYSSNRETLTGHHVPPVVSVYEANESKMSFQPDSLEFGSFGPGINSAKLVDGGLEKLSHECTLPHDPVDIPGSPCSSDLSPQIELQQFTSHPQRDREVQQTYQMKEEDFPPLSFCQQQASSTAVSNGGSSSS
ncbi:unnamed protein product [Sphagnum jensenii]|uniref:Polymerase nucleotidyl transferase domain-containing protein n=1 Tax=Sphagnum jensenii TaxID=128206 RepID=A0ABP0WBH6_9BRYO